MAFNILRSVLGVWKVPSASHEVCSWLHRENSMPQLPAPAIEFSKFTFHQRTGVYALELRSDSLPIPDQPGVFEVGW